MTELTKEEAQELLAKAQAEGRAKRTTVLAREVFEIIEPEEPTPFDR